MRSVLPDAFFIYKNSERGKNMKINLSDRFNYSRLIRFVLPSIVMMIFTSIYGVVDGFFVSNFVGKTPFAAVNFIMPFLMILGSVGFMFGTGGGALIAKTMGEGKADKANQLFSLFVYVTALAVLSLLRWESFLLGLSPLSSAQRRKCLTTALPTEE